MLSYLPSTETHSLCETPQSVDLDALEEAEDSDDPKAAIVALLVEVLMSG